MSLAFLEVHPSAANAISPIAASGGRRAVRDGWHVVTSYGDPAAERRAVAEAVGVADVSHIVKTELQGALDHELGTADRREAGWSCPITPTRALVLGPVPEPAAAGVTTLDVTAVFGALVIAGPLARETFARFCALDLRDSRLPVGGFRPGSVARTPGFVLREADERFLVVFGAAYSAYLWDVVLDAATRLGGRAVGSEAIDA
jgi:glycine cleavage system aminomethyltransferase T